MGRGGLMTEAMADAVRSNEVDEFLLRLDHPMASHLAQLRDRILDVVPEGTVENVKWNGPNYAVGGFDRVTLGVHPRGRMRVVLHRGVKVIESDGFTFDDDSGLIRWAAPDRGVITVGSSSEYKADADAILDLVDRWLRTARQ